MRKSSLSVVNVSSLSLNSVAPSDTSAHSEEWPYRHEGTSPVHDLEQGCLSPVPGTILSDRPVQGSTENVWRRRDCVRSNAWRRESVGSLQSTGNSIQSTCDTPESRESLSRCGSNEVGWVGGVTSAQPVRKRDSNAKSQQVLYAENRKSQKICPTEPQTFDERMSGILKGRYYMFFSISCLLWVLGGREIYILGDPPLSTDRPVYYLYLVCLVQLLLDLMLRSPFEHHYFLGFYFWLDVSVFSVTWTYKPKSSPEQRFIPSVQVAQTCTRPPRRL